LKSKTLSLPQRLTLVLGLVILVVEFGSSFQYEYTVVVNSPAEVGGTGQENGDTFLTLLRSLTVDMFPLRGLIGSLMVASMINKYGRKGALMISNIFSIVSATLMGYNKMLSSFMVIIFARIFLGIRMTYNVVPLYLGELVPKNLRGAVGFVNQLFITIGIFVAQIFGFQCILGTEEEWPILFGLTGIFEVIELILLPFFPESPRYTLIQRGDEEGAEIEEIPLEDELEKAAGQVSVLKFVSTKTLWWQLISILVMMAGQQFSGINVVYYYSDQIFKEAGVKENHIQYITAGTGAVNVVMTILAVFIVERLGRRLLILIGFSICCLACIVLTIALSLQVKNLQDPDYLKRSGPCDFSPIGHCGWGASVMVCVIGHAMGPSPIPSLIIEEIFLQSTQLAAFMIGGTVHWLSNFSMGLFFPFLQESLGAYCFIIFAAICFITVFIIPETRTKSFVELNQIFARINKMQALSQRNLNPPPSILLLLSR
uniref:Solute carrier family 2, facilitated glucose transporter member 5 n=1 Tax=Monodelphis domestica TaxID=13616 RepID=A0A5F8GWK4_MONDO